MLIIVVFFAFLIISLLSASIVVGKHKREKDAAAQLMAAKKNEALQPVVTELKTYSESTVFKLSPVTIPDMRKEAVKTFPLEPMKTEPPAAVAPTPIIQQSENHYHFEDLNSGITYLGSVLLIMFALFSLFKLFEKITKKLSVQKAIKISRRILKSFEKDINHTETYLEYNKSIHNQIVFNKIIIDQYKNSSLIPELMVVNSQLLDNLDFTQRDLVSSLESKA
jgi:uncharacterized SAM-binding protein YcdF (DUF218 family)